MTPLEHAVAGLPPELSVLQASVFGTTEPAAVTGLVEGFCGDHLGSSVAACPFAIASVGVVLGLRLEDGRDVVVKAHQPRWSTAFLAAVVRVQRHLAARGFPCPRPLLDPAPLGRGWATVDELVPDPGPSDPGAAARRGSAAGLARAIATAREVDGVDALEDHPQATPAESLWPEPHSPLFDFRATAAGAEAVDVLARRGAEARDADSSGRVVAHCDWSARNVRLDGHRLVVAYDWDALARVPESTAVGQAAATWSATAEPDDPGPPSPQEVAAYLADYERARGAPLPEAARRAVGGAALYTLAYTARCEHALAVRGLAAPHHTRGRTALERYGTAYLDLPDLLP